MSAQRDSAVCNMTVKQSKYDDDLLHMDVKGMNHIKNER